MTEIAYMVREDWAQRGTAMRESSDRVRSWLGAARPAWVVGKPEKFNDALRSADRETAVHISGERAPRPVVDFSELEKISSHAHAPQIAAVALHPYEDEDCEALRTVVAREQIGKVYVQIWARNDMVRHWLEGICATDLHRPARSTPPEPLHRAACELIVNEEYNGLSTGNGKATVVQLVRSFEVEGYAADVDTWLRAYFAAGGSFRHAETVKKFVGEIRDGKRHRAPQRFRQDIVSILREQVERERPFPSE